MTPRKMPSPCRISPAPICFIDIVCGNDAAEDRTASCRSDTHLPMSAASSIPTGATRLRGNDAAEDKPAVPFINDTCFTAAAAMMPREDAYELQRTRLNSSPLASTRAAALMPRGMRGHPVVQPAVFVLHMRPRRRRRGETDGTQDCRRRNCSQSTPQLQGGRGNDAAEDAKSIRRLSAG